jgi:hypothetical protein
MGHYFNTWRRKAGCAVLILSVASCLLWVRSLGKDVIFQKEISGWRYYLGLSEGQFFWTVEGDGYFLRRFNTAEDSHVPLSTTTICLCVLSSALILWPINGKAIPLPQSISS